MLKAFNKIVNTLAGKDVILDIKGLTLEKNSTKILNNVNLRLSSRIFAVIGPNGSGKTSLAYCIMGVHKDYKGSILLNGKDISKLKISERARLGVTLAWQIPAEFEGLRVKDYLLASCKCDDLLSDEKIDEIQKMLKRAGLCSSYLDKKLSDLSGGERKRIELVSVALMKPKLVILDEPDSGIDILSFEKIKKLITDISKDSYVLLITHSKIIASLSQKAALLYKGSIVKTDSTNEVLKLYNQLDVDKEQSKSKDDNEGGDNYE